MNKKIKAFWTIFSSSFKDLALVSFFSVVLGLVQISGIGMFVPIVKLVEGDNLSSMEGIPFFGQLISSLPQDKLKALIILLTGIVLIIIGRSSLRVWISILNAKIKNTIDGYWQRRVIKHWLTMTPLQHHTFDHSRLMQICGQEIANLGRAGASCALIASSSIQIIITSVFMLVISWKIVAGVLCFICFVMVPLLFVIKKISHAAKKDVQSTRNYTSRVFDVIKRTELIDVFSTKKQEKDDLEVFLKGFLKTSLNLQKIRAIVPLVIESLSGIFLCLAILYFYVTFKDGEGIKYLLLFIGGVIVIQPQLIILNSSIAFMARVYASFEVVEEFLNMPATNLMKEEQKAHDINSYDLTLENVTFFYETEGKKTSILDNVSLHIPEKKITMLFGASGAGKTTLLSILMGLYQVQHGSILLGGVNIKEFSPEQLSQTMLFMSQEDTIFHGTIQENVLYGNHNPQGIEDAIKLSKSNDFIKDFPRGLETFVGSDGGLISGGQRQRLSLARILANKPKMLLLDEPTSNLDRYTENDIVNNLLKLRNDGNTIVLSTHKIELAAFADHLLWFENGKILEGTFEDFKEHFAKLSYSNQLGD